jgi:hypothetical protein
MRSKRTPSAGSQLAFSESTRIKTSRLKTGTLARGTIGRRNFIEVEENTRGGSLGPIPEIEEAGRLAAMIDLYGKVPARQAPSPDLRS